MPTRPTTFLYALMLTDFVLLSSFSFTKTIYMRVSTKSLPDDAKCPLPVEDCQLSQVTLVNFVVFSLPFSCTEHSCSLLFFCLKNCTFFSSSPQVLKIVGLAWFSLKFNSDHSILHSGWPGKLQCLTSRNYNTGNWIVYLQQLSIFVIFLISKDF